MTPQIADGRWLWQYVARHRWSGLAAIGCGMIAGVTASIEPFLIGVIIDEISKGASMDQLVSLILLMLGLAVVTVIAFFGQRHFSGEIAYSVNYDVRRDLFDNMLTLENDFYQRHATGDLISRMHGDVVMIWRLLAITFTRLGSAVTVVIMTFILLGSISLPLTLVVFMVLAISTSIQIRVGLLLAPVFEQVQDQAGTVSSVVQDAVSGIQTVKTTGREAEIAAKFREENEEFRNRWLFFRRRNEPVGMMPNMISELTRGIVVLFGGILTINGTLTIGNFAQFLVYLTMISTVLLQIGTVYQRLQQTRGALTRLTPLRQATNISDAPDADALPQPRGEIVYENVSVKIEDTWLLQDISLRIPAGQVVAIVGPTGCGKTLLVNLLARVLDPTEGHILIDDTEITDLKLEDLREAVAYVPETTFLFSQELHRNIRMGKANISNDELNEAIHISRMSNDLPQLPEGLDTLVGEKGVMLSGGQKQRVAIARAVVRDPTILILDDALSSVDMHTAADILNDLRGVLRTRTSIIIAHRIATVKDADHIFVMREGRVVENGTHDELIARGGDYAHMVERELKEEIV